jgi:hypothetical protein
MGHTYGLIGGGGGGGQSDGGVKLSAIVITTPPTKTAYKAGESFSAAGMVVTATYTNGATAQATGYTYDTSPLSDGTTSIVFTYTEQGITRTATQAIEVTKTGLAVPSQSGSLTYSGDSQSPTWTGYDSAKMTLSGATTGTDAGSYSVTFALTDPALYQWDDGSTEDKAATWEIGQAASTLTVSKDSITLDNSTTSDTFTIGGSYDGELSVESSDTTIATATLSGTTVTVSSVSTTNGTVTITVRVTEGANYAASSQTVSVTAALIPPLNEYTWQQIGEISKAGEGDLHWDVGDAKQDTFNGKVGDYLTLDNEPLCVYILDFNHEDGGVASKNIMWGAFISALSGGVPTALCDSKHGYTSDNGAKTFNMSHWGNVNYGGWAGCDLRYDILGATNTAPSDYGTKPTYSRVGYDATGKEFTSPKADTLLAAFPEDLRAVMRLRAHYADNYGGGSDSALYVTKITDAISLMMEFEVFGSNKNANSHEAAQQTQFAYFKNGGSKTIVEYNSTSVRASVWLGSPGKTGSSNFCADDGGNFYTYYAAYSKALATVFKT